MLVDTGLTFREIVMNDPLPKGTIQQAVIGFLNGRDDAAIFGAMAVNAYIDERRMTEDVEIVSIHAAKLAEAPNNTLTSNFTSLCAFARSAKVSDSVSISLLNPRIVIWWTCDQSKLYHRRSGSTACWS